MQLNSVVGGYKVIELVGEGSTGTVFRGMDILLEREVALKLFRPELTHNPQLVQRFRAEAVALARLNHPHIVTLHQLFCDIERCFMVLEFVRGETLESLIRRSGPLPWQDVLPWICQALDGLEHAHQLKVVHCEIKPANLIVTESGDIKLMDFRNDPMLEVGAAVQTRYSPDMLKYLAPEQMQGGPIDHRVDIYAIGMVLYEMLTAHAPSIQEEKTDDGELQAPRNEVLKSPRALVPTIPLRLEAAVLRALGPSPTDRFQSAAGFREELEAILMEASTAQEADDGEASIPEFVGRSPGVSADTLPGLHSAGALRAPVGTVRDLTAPSDQAAVLEAQELAGAALDEASAKRPWIPNRNAAFVTLLLLPVFFHAFYLVSSALTSSENDTATPADSIVATHSVMAAQDSVFQAAIASRAANETIAPRVSIRVLPRELELAPQKVKPLENPLVADGVVDQSIYSMVPAIAQAISSEGGAMTSSATETTDAKDKPQSVRPRRSRQPHRVDGGWTIISD